MSHCEGVKRPKQSLGILEFLGFKLSWLSPVGRWLAQLCGAWLFAAASPKDSANLEFLGILKFNPELEFPRNSRIP